MNSKKYDHSGSPIVAGSAQALQPVRLRLTFAIVALVLAAIAGLLRGLTEPSTGWRFEADAQQRVIAIELSGAGRLMDVTQVSGRNCQGASLEIALDAQLMRETGGIAQYYSEHERFYSLHAQLWELLSCTAAAQGRIRVQHAQGETLLPLSTKSVSELGLRFWFAWVFALLAFSVGLAVWVYRPLDQSARWYLLASACYCFWMMLVATMGTRLLSQPSWGLQTLHLACHVAGHLYLISLCMLLWRFPASLDSPRLSQSGLLWGMMAWASASMVVNVMQWVPGINLGFRLPNLVLALVLAILFSVQWKNSRADPLARAPLKWLGFLLLITLSLAFLTTLFALANQWTVGRMAYGLAFMSVIFLGFVPLVTQLKLFKLALWWTRAWLWFLGGVLVVLLDVLLMHWLALDGGTALGLAIALAGWVYFPLRQWLWQRLSHSALPATQEILPDIVSLTTQQSAQAHTQVWQALWEKHWQPQSLRTLALVELLGIHEQGQLLLIPPLGQLPALELGMPLRGARLYNSDDLKRAGEIYTLVQRSLQAHDALQQGAQQERQRIAADLHDDLGVKLLTIAQTARNPQHGERVAELARQALEDMRLAVRGLTAHAVSAAESQADWRADLFQRLEVAGIQADWQGNEPPEGLMLSSTAQVQLTRVLRETLSNVIRHSQATRCHIGAEWGADQLLIYVHDDGQGLPARQSLPGQRQGLGLSNIERRIHKLGGLVQWLAVQPHGLRMQAEIPLTSLSTSLA